jgi:glutamate formiminotransferase
VAVGARKPLIAFNVNLATDDITLAKRIAETIRESSGGLPGVQAMAVQLENPGQPRYAQVSMNLVDWEQTGITRVVSEIRHMARQFGADIDHCELIGLAPAGAMLEVVADTLALRGFNEDQVLELRLAKDR